MTDFLALAPFSAPDLGVEGSLSYRLDGQRVPLSSGFIQQMEGWLGAVLPASSHEAEREASAVGLD
jgi:hypothetical protein